MNGAMILLIVAIICWFLAAVPLPEGWKNPVAIGWLGLFFWGLSQLVR